MTCIVGIIHNESIWLGGDACISDDCTAMTISAPKVFVKGEFLIGSCGSYRINQILEHKVTLPAAKRTKPQRYMQTVFIDTLSKALKKEGLSLDESDILVGWRGALYTISGDYSVFPHADTYASIGSGAEYALGSLHTTNGTRKPHPRTRINRALSAAAKFDRSVSRPFAIIHV